MPFLKCTQKLLKAIGEPMGQEGGTSTAHPLGDWYANVLIVAGRKALLFTSATTLYSFAVLEIKKAQLIRINGTFLEHLRLNLAHERFPVHVIESLVVACRNIRLARTDDRRVLGSMNEVARLLDGYVMDRRNSDVLEINKLLNKAPLKLLGYKFPTEVLRERLLGVIEISGKSRERVFLN